MVDHTNEETTVDGEETPAPVDSGGESSAENGGPETWNLDSLPPELDYFRSSEAYQVELTGFQGPMDLLLHLIDREQVDIYDIPIARITDQFIQHIEVIKTISLDEAGEFIAMAATLMVIKMKMLIPSHGEEEDGEEEDPRAELVRKLIEYRRFKDAAEALQQQETEIEMFDLLSALAGIFDRMQSRHVHDIVRESFTVEEKMSLIEEKVGSGGTVRFEDLFSGDSIKMEVIVTFIAILEMVKRGRLNFMQTEPGAPIWIQHPGVDEEVGDEVDLITLDEDHATEEMPENMPEGAPNEWENES